MARRSTGRRADAKKEIPKKSTASAKKAIKSSTKKAANDQSSPEPTASDQGESDEESWALKLTTKDERLTRIISCNTELDGEVATLDKQTGRYVQTLRLVSDQPFSLQSVLMSAGKHAGRQFIMLQPEALEHERFPFLKLPPEIRNMIYSFALHRPGLAVAIDGKRAGKIRSHWRRETGGYMNGNVAANLMAVNRQVYLEAAPYLYACHRFEFRDTTMLEQFLHMVGPDLTALLTRVKVGRQYTSSRKHAFKLLSSATSLRCLQVSSFNGSHYYTSSHLTVPVFAAMVFPVVQAIWAKEGSREKAVDVAVCHEGFTRTCTAHPYYWVSAHEKCDKKERAYIKYNDEVKIELERLLDEAEQKRSKKEQGKAVVTGSAKTRAGRKTKAVNYADDSESDEYDD